MNRFRDNRGMTLLELVIAIFIGAIITTAAVTILLLGLRLYKQSNDTIKHQNQVRVGITVIEELVKGNVITGYDDEAVYTTGDVQLLRYNEAAGKIFTAQNGQVMGNVTGFEAGLKDNLLTLKLEVDGESYEISVASRVEPENANPASEIPGEGGAVKSAGFEGVSSENVLETAIGNRELTANVRAFLKTLNSQMDSTGRIQTEAGEGEYYSEWYIGSFSDNPGWSEETPWCACFISWALEECGGYLRGQIPRFANVDSFLAEFVTTDMWKAEDPQAGDIIFFDWIVDDENDAQHVGVVISADEEWIYTIEGNSNGRVEICRYNAGDRRILGYGILNWT